MVTFFFLTLAVLGSANPYGGSLSLRWTSTQLEGSWPSLVASEGMRVFVILAPSIPSLVLAAWLWRTAAHHGERRLIVALSIVVLSSCGFRFAVAGLGSDYLYMPGWITSGLLVAITVRRFIDSDTRKDTLKPLVTLVVVFGSMSVLVRSLPNTSFVLLSTTVAIAIIHLARRQTEQRTGVKETWSRRQSVPVLSIAVLTVAIVTMSVIDNQPSYFKAFVEARTGETNANRLTWSPSRELLDVADFLQRNTRQDSRIALTLCDAAQTACQYDQPYNFSVFSHRYFLSLGGTIIAGWPTQDLVYLDYRNSIVTDENKLGAVVEYWKSRGADYGVIDKERLTSSTELPQLIPALTRVFESERYVVVRLST